MKIIKLKTTKNISITKETPEERKERLRHWQTTRTKIIPSKKQYKRQDYKKFDS